MTAIEEFVGACLAALAEDRPIAAVKELMERAVHDQAVTAELAKGRTRVVHCSPDLTVAHIVIPIGLPRSLPHDHRMWSVVGIAHGKEENEFFRRSDGTLTSSGGRVLDEQDVLAMGPETIHAVGNPLSHTVSSALHVYGGDLVNGERSMWCEPDWREEPYDAVRAIGTEIQAP